MYVSGCVCLCVCVCVSLSMNMYMNMYMNSCIQTNQRTEMCKIAPKYHTYTPTKNIYAKISTYKSSEIICVTFSLSKKFHLSYLSFAAEYI